jgi:prevent-host-death family protein
MVLMKTASVTELKAQLSRFLRMVKRGSEVQILDRGVPVARLVAIATPASSESERLERLARAGIVRRGSGQLGWLLEEPPLRTAGGKLGEALSEDREDRL